MNLFKICKFSSLKDIIISHTNIDIWNQHFCDWTFILKTLVCAESVVRVLPDLIDARDSIERISRDFFYKTHVRVLMEAQFGTLIVKA